MPGSYFHFSINENISKIEQKKFWSLNVNNSNERFSAIKAKQYANQYFSLLKDSVRLRLRSDVPLGSALSGGLDSSSIVYLIREILAEESSTEYQNTFSCVYKENPSERYCDESQYIDLLTNELDIKNHQITPIADEIPLELERLIYCFDSPPENTCMSGWHTYKLVKDKGIVVTLDGQGADEQLTGYLYYFAYFIAHLKLLDLFRRLITL